MFYFKKGLITASVGAVVCVSGCGGGSQGSASVGQDTHTSKAGDAVLTYFGQPKPLLTTGSGQVAVLGQAGATFSTVTLEPPPNLNDTSIIFDRTVLGYGQLYKLPYTGYSAQLLYQVAAGINSFSVSAYGNVAFSSVGFLYSVRTDGTGFKAINDANYVADTPSYSLDGTNRLAFCGDLPDLFILPGAGGTPTLVRNDNADYGVAWSPDGTMLAYSVNTGTGSNADIYETPSSGSYSDDASPNALKNTGILGYPAWSSDGSTVACNYVPSGSSKSQVVKFAINSPDYFVSLTPSGDNDSGPCFSPDGTKIAFYRSNSGGATAGIYIADAAGGSQTLALADPSNNLNSIPGSLGWSPFLPKETVVAASGSTFYHQAASGFLLSQVNDQFGSMVAFTATTPSSATIQAPTASGAQQPMLFTISANAITSIGYINSYFSPGTTITLTSTPTVVVSVDATTGQVDLVAPAATAKPASTSNSDGTVTYRTRFKAIYDGKGDNLAPSGATILTVNPKTGKLVSFK